MPPAPLAAPRVSWHAVVRFWSALALETFTRRSLARMVRTRLHGETVSAANLEAVVPREGPLVFALNHLPEPLPLGGISALLAAVERVRPDVPRTALIIVGRGASAAGERLSRRLLRWAVGAFYRRWGGHVLHLATGNVAPRLVSLRAFRERAASRPVVAYPEGRAGRELAAMRPGAGRWLARLPAPTLPVGVWGFAGGWQVAVGAAGSTVGGD